MNQCPNTHCGREQEEPLDIYLGCEFCVAKFTHKMKKISKSTNPNCTNRVYYSKFSESERRSIAIDIANMYKVVHRRQPEMIQYLEDKYKCRITMVIYRKLCSPEAFRKYNLTWKHEI